MGTLLFSIIQSLPPSPILSHYDACKYNEHAEQNADNREHMTSVFHMHPESHLNEHLQDRASNQDDVDKVFINLAASYCRERDYSKQDR